MPAKHKESDLSMKLYLKKIKMLAFGITSKKKQKCRQKLD